MKIYPDNYYYNRPFDDQTQVRIHLESVRFIQQYGLGYGDDTKEKQSEPNEDFDEIDALLRIENNYFIFDILFRQADKLWNICMPEGDILHKSIKQGFSDGRN